MSQEEEMIKTTSLEMSRLLKENGFNQRNMFCHIKCKRVIKGQSQWEVMTEEEAVHMPLAWEYDTRISAPTTDELLEELPYKDLCKYEEYRIDTTGMSREMFIDLFRDPNKLAEVWLFLKQNNLIQQSKGKD